MPIPAPPQPAGYRVIAWMGGTAFAGSLLWFLYCYLFDFDRRPAAPPAAALTLDVILFSVFALHHSLLARTRAKAFVRRHVPVVLERSLYTWVASFLFVVVCTAWRALPGHLYSLEGPLRVAAYACQAVGLLLTVRGSAVLDVLDLAGIRQVLGADATRHVALETSGLYGVVRHPLYLAWAIFVFTTPDMTATRALFAVVSTGYLALAIPFEERSLVEVFGDDYEAYRGKVRWRMLPGLY